MNTEEKAHGVEPNEFGQILQTIGRRLEEHVVAIVVVVCAVLAVSAGWVAWSRQVSTATVDAWSLMESAHTIDDYGNIADKYKSTVPGKWAKLRQSEMYLQNGMSTMFSERELALLDLKRAKEGFEQLAAEKGSEATIHERSLWGLALALETTSDGDTTKAIEAYQKLLNEVPETIFKTIAENRVSELKTGGSKDFYAWFSKQNPKPAESRPKDGALKSDEDAGIPQAPSDFRPNPPGTDEKANATDSKKTEASTFDKSATDAAVKPEEGPQGTKTEDAKAEKPAPPESKPPEDGATPKSKEPGSDN